MTVISASDQCALRIIIDEGIFLEKLRHQQEHFRESAPALMLVAMPFLAVIEHDVIPFLNRIFNLSLDVEDSRISRMRHLTKMLNSKYLNYEAYSDQAEAILQVAREKFGTNVSSPDTTQVDVGICYYNSIPIDGTYTIAHYFAPDASTPLTGDYAFSIGKEMGASGAALLCLANEFVKEKDRLQSERFVTTANDFQYSQLMVPLQQKEVFDEVAFFMFSELLMHLSAVQVLSSANFFSDRLWLKFTTIDLCHILKTIDAFLSHAHQSCKIASYPSLFLKDAASLVTRDERKFIKKLKPLRNAFIHYDFGPRNVPVDVEGMAPDDVLEVAITNATDMNMEEYAQSIGETCLNLMLRISNLIGFPRYDPAKNVI